jgi:hypothetical protein
MEAIHRSHKRLLGAERRRHLLRGYPEMFSQQPVAKAGDRLLKDGRSGGLYGDIAFRIETHRTVGDVG